MIINGPHGKRSMKEPLEELLSGTDALEKTFLLLTGSHIVLCSDPGCIGIAFRHITKEEKSPGMVLLRLEELSSTIFQLN